MPTAVEFDKNFLTVQSRLKIANNSNFESTSNRRAASAWMKTNLSKDNISIQFEGEPCSCTPRNLQIVVDYFVLCGLTGWIELFPSPVLSTCSLNS